MTQRFDEGLLGRIAERRIFFGHHSVGFNIVDGMRELLSTLPGGPFRIVDCPPDGPVPPGTGFHHGKVGKNRHPLSKIESFRRLASAEGDRPFDAALFKFCYVDIDGATDVESLFSAYRDAVGSLAVERPRMRIGHSTVPLTTGDEGWGNRIRVLLGRRESEVPGNVRRNRFNELLRAEYGGDGSLFDLARHESTRPDGTRSLFLADGRPHERLDRGYSDDGGHLDAAGREWVAGHFVRFLGTFAAP